MTTDQLEMLTEQYVIKFIYCIKIYNTQNPSRSVEIESPISFSLSSYIDHYSVNEYNFAKTFYWEELFAKGTCVVIDAKVWDKKTGRTRRIKYDLINKVEVINNDI